MGFLMPCSALPEASISHLVLSNFQFPNVFFVENQNLWHLNELAKEKKFRNLSWNFFISVTHL